MYCMAWCVGMYFAVLCGSACGNIPCCMAIGRVPGMFFLILHNVLYDLVCLRGLPYCAASLLQGKRIMYYETFHTEAIPYDFPCPGRNCLIVQLGVLKYILAHCAVRCTRAYFFVHGLTCWGCSLPYYAIWHSMNVLSYTVWYYVPGVYSLAWHDLPCWKRRFSLHDSICLGGAVLFCRR